MTNYAVVHFYEFEQELQMSVLRERFDDVVSAEKFRSKWLNEYPKASPQEIKVIQYVR